MRGHDNDPRKYLGTRWYPVNRVAMFPHGQRCIREEKLKIELKIENSYIDNYPI